MSYFLFIPLSLRSLVRLSLQVSLGVNLYGVRRMCHVAAATQSAQLRPLRRQTCPPTLLATTVFRTAQPTVELRCTRATTGA